MLNNEQFFANYKNTIEQMLASNPAAPESVKKLVELNLQTAESAVEDASKLALLFNYHRANAFITHRNGGFKIKTAAACTAGIMA